MPYDNNEDNEFDREKRQRERLRHLRYSDDNDITLHSVSRRRLASYSTSSVPKKPIIKHKIMLPNDTNTIIGTLSSQYQNLYSSLIQNLNTELNKIAKERNVFAIFDNIDLEKITLKTIEEDEMIDLLLKNNDDISNMSIDDEDMEENTSIKNDDVDIIYNISSDTSSSTQQENIDIISHIPTFHDILIKIEPLLKKISKISIGDKIYSHIILSYLTYAFDPFANIINVNTPFVDTLFVETPVFTIPALMLIFINPKQIQEYLEDYNLHFLDFLDSMFKAITEYNYDELLAEEEKGPSILNAFFRTFNTRGVASLIVNDRNIKQIDFIKVLRVSNKMYQLLFSPAIWKALAPYTPLLPDTYWKKMIVNGYQNLYKMWKYNKKEFDNIASILGHEVISVIISAYTLMGEETIPDELIPYVIL